MVVQNITQNEEFQKTVSSGDITVVHFYADWAEQCSQMNDVLDELSKQNDLKAVKFIKCPAEDIPEVSLKYEVSAVPTFILFQNGKVLDRVNGADAANLTKKINQQVSRSSLLSHNSVPVPTKEDLNSRLKKLINSAPVLLFMKGTANEPRCGFSKTTIQILEELNAEYKTFDILNDEEVRQGLKTYSNWPTYPQLYVNGELIGGVDIIKELKESGELESLLPKKKSFEDRLKSLINESPVMVFMKGDRNTPRCGFSRRLMEILRETGVEFKTFDILTDEEVRQGLKTYSNWPTYPQVYVKGELIGGLDIIVELKESGELMNSLSGQ